MKITSTVGIVAFVHCVILAIIFFPACGTVMGPVLPPPPPLMPPPPPGEVSDEVKAEPLSEQEAVVVEEEKAAKSWTGKTTTYTVGKGDCLSVIAKRYKLRMADIMALNAITDADRLSEGQELLLPGDVDLDAPVPVVKTRVSKTPAPSVPAVEGGVYVVRSGDTLSGIAHRLGTTVKAISEANSLTNDKILVDQKLVVPGWAAAMDPKTPAAGDAWDAEINLDSAPVSPSRKPRLEKAPDPKQGAGAAARAPEAQSRRGDGATTRSTRPHKVERDEDLMSIGLMWGVSVAELVDLNNLTNTTLKTGQVLQIPMRE